MGMAAMGGKGGKGLGKDTEKDIEEQMSQLSTSQNQLLEDSLGEEASRDFLLVYPEMRKSSKDYMYVILSQCTTYANHAKRKTINVVDVLYALKNCGTRLMGF